MLENELDASIFLYKSEVYYKEFEDILSKITSFYFLLKKEKRVVHLSDENGIRDIFVKDYINNPEIKKSIGLNYFVLPEVPETNSTGRTDIRIFSPNTFYNQDEYYVIECKRLDKQARRGVSGLNYKYIANGIHRFTTSFYASYYKTNAMIGFVVDSLDIHENIKDINYLLKNKFTQIDTTDLIRKENFISHFDFHYSSGHLTEDKQKLKLYHLMFSFVD